jgi:hypothetical protein
MESGCTVRAEDRQIIQVSGPVYQQLTDIKEERKKQLKRQVTYSEVIEGLLRLLDSAVIS